MLTGVTGDEDLGKLRLQSLGHLFLRKYTKYRLHSYIVEESFLLSNVLTRLTSVMLVIINSKRYEFYWYTVVSIKFGKSKLERFLFPGKTRLKSLDFTGPIYRTPDRYFLIFIVPIILFSRKELQVLTGFH